MVTGLLYTMFWILALSLHFDGAKIIHVIWVLIGGFGGCWRFFTEIRDLDLHFDMVTGLWYTYIPNIGESKTCDHIQIKVKMLKPGQEPQGPAKAPNQDLKDMVILCTFKIKIEIQNLDHVCIKDQWPYPNQDKILRLSQEPPASSKAPIQDLKDMDVLCTFKIKLESQNSEHGHIKDSDHV